MIMDSTSFHPNGQIPADILSMMQERGYSGPEPANCYDAFEWLYSKYSAWLVITPRWATPIEKEFSYGFRDDDNKELFWVLHAKDVAKIMDCDGFCKYYAIDSIYEDGQDYVDPYEIVVHESSQAGYYKTPEQAVFAGVLRVMKLFD